MALTTDESAELASLQAAQLQLRTGKMPSRVTFNGRDTAFAKVDLNDLNARVAELTAKQSRRRGGAIRVRL